MHFVKLAGPVHASSPYAVDIWPREEYEYRVSACTKGCAWSSVDRFRSLYSEGETRLAIFGDLGAYAWSNLGNLKTDAESGLIDAIVHLGDHAYNMGGDDERHGDAYLDHLQPILGRIPWVPVLGNHEYFDGDSFHRFLNQSAMGMSNGRSGLGSLLSRATGQYGAAAHGGAAEPSNTSRWFSVDIGLIHLVALDGNVYDWGIYHSETGYRQAQLSWLRKDLTAASENREKVPWILMLSHYPIYCSSVSIGGYKVDMNETSNLPVLSEKLRTQGKQWQGCAEGQSYADTSREDLEPLMMEFGVDIYFAGHMHAYESTWPVHNNTPMADNFVNPTAPVHITTGAGGAPGYDSFGNNWGPWTRKQIMAWGYGRVVAHNASMLSYSHVLNENSSVVDEVLIKQAKHGPFPSLKTDDKPPSFATVVDNATAVLAAGGCPCQNASLCASISRTGPERVYAFHIGSISYCHDCPGFTPRTTWREYDWAQITTIGYQNWHSTEWPKNTMDPELLCHAHAMDVRVTLLPPPTVWGMPADWSNTTFVANATQFMAAAVTSVFADGYDIDIEKDIRSKDEQLYKHSLTSLVKEAVSTMHDRNPHSHVTMATPSEGSGENACGVMYGRIYDWLALSKLVDFFVVMDCALPSHHTPSAFGPAPCAD